MDIIKTYLELLEYGNKDMSGGLTEAWLDSSLKISPTEQVKLIQRMIQENLPIKPSAIQMTKALFFSSRSWKEGGNYLGKSGCGPLAKRLDGSWGGSKKGKTSSHLPITSEGKK